MGFLFSVFSKKINNIDRGPLIDDSHIFDGAKHHLFGTDLFVFTINGSIYKIKNFLHGNDKKKLYHKFKSEIENIHPNINYDKILVELVNKDYYCIDLINNDVYGPVNEMTSSVKWLSNDKIGFLTNSRLRIYNEYLEIKQSTLIPDSVGDFSINKGFVIYCRDKKVYSFHYKYYDRTTENELFDTDIEPTYIDFIDSYLLMYDSLNKKLRIYNIETTELMLSLDDILFDRNKYIYSETEFGFAESDKIQFYDLIDFKYVDTYYTDKPISVLQHDVIVYNDLSFKFP